MQRTKSNPLRELKGRVSPLKALPFSLQQILAMFMTNIVPIGIVAAAANPALTQSEILVLVQNAMIAAGIATFIQSTPIWKLGSGLPIFMGVSFTFVVPLTAVAAKHGYGAVCAAAAFMLFAPYNMFAGAFERKYAALMMLRRIDGNVIRSFNHNELNPFCVLDIIKPDGDELCRPIQPSSTLPLKHHRGTIQTKRISLRLATGSRTQTAPR